MSKGEYKPSARTVFIAKLEREIAPEVWKGLWANGSLRIDIDTDVLGSYGEFRPYGRSRSDDDHDERGAEAQNWVSYFVRLTIMRLIDAGHLKVEQPK